MIVPIVFTSITVGISSISDSTNISRLGIKTLVYYLSTSLLAIITGLFLVNIIKPGNNYMQAPNIDSKEILSGSTSFLDMIYRIVPTNPLSSMVNGDMLSIIFFSLLVMI